MTRLKLLILLLVLSSMLFAQDFITISGSIADDSTGQRLPYAQIAWPGSNVGTISNEDGRFTLSVPSMLAKDSLVVVYMGYVTTKFPVEGLLKGNEVTLKLKSRKLQLPEREVISYSPEEVIRQVVAHIPAN